MEALDSRQQFPMLLEIFKEYFRDIATAIPSSEEGWDRNKICAEILEVLTISACKEELLGTFCTRSKG